ncbi:syntaxin-19 isoform X2 [Syngnathoides biaculeatus]|uniref:syntaxin-19 isoform X2 n=1 Tax=Syngnathoides biaculeatus TaxID=300417 RepID=UPI002ADE6551|nr:syntaxin-19 isoform X2 [Syngnathoides biaculeatus]
MRDRLKELLERTLEFSEGGSLSSNLHSEEDDDTNNSVTVGVIIPEAILFEQEPVIDNFLLEVQQIRNDIITLEIEQKILVAAMRRFSIMKKESSITKDIKLQAESLQRRLDKLSKQVQKAEEQHGPTAVATRIQRCQQTDIYCKFQQVMRQYNEGLLTKQEHCKHFIIRQLEVSGRDVTEAEVNEMVATGKWEVFNENLLNDVRITHSQLSEIEQRHKELLSLESNMNELRDLFMDVFMLVEEQGTQIEHIQTNVERTQDYVAASNEKFKLAARYKKKNPLRQICCCCCPPWKCCF